MGSDVPPQPKKVCVVGAGMSGLAAARELRRVGLAVTVMEQGGDVGGQWLYDPRTDDDDVGVGDLLRGAAVKVHSGMYASMRLMSPRECMGFSDFQFVPRPGPGRDPRRFPCHREVHRYLKDFCAAFRLAGAVRLNTRVLCVAPVVAAGTGGGDADNSAMKWRVTSARVDNPDGGEEEEVFDAVVVANGHYSQPRLPAIRGIERWRRRQLHSHSYRVPDPFRGEVVVVVGCGESGLDIATELCGVAKEVHLAARSVEDARNPAPAVSRMLANHGEIRLHAQVDHLREDGAVAFADGSRVAAADAVIYCTGYVYSLPFLETGGAVRVGEHRVGPLYEHTFPPSLAPSLSFVGVPMKVFAPWLFEAQARWVARILSGREALPPPDDMLRAVEKDYRARELAGVPEKDAHVVHAMDRREIWEFAYRHSDIPRMEDWKEELFWAGHASAKDDREAFRDRDDDSESVREGLRRWHDVASVQYDAALAAGDHAAGPDEAEAAAAPAVVHMASPPARLASELS